MLIKKIFAQPLFGNIDDPFAGEAYNAETAFGLKTFISNALSATVAVAGLAFFAYLLYGGFTYLTAAGDEKNLDKAKKTLGSATIGLFIVAASWFAVRILETILKIDILKICFPGPDGAC